MGIGAAIAFAIIMAGGYQLSCDARACSIRSSQLSFRLQRVEGRPVIRPVSIRVEGAQNRGGPEWTKETTQYRVVPDFCETQPNRCHYLFGPGDDVMKWSEREDSANRIPTRTALAELAPARTLSVSTSHAILDVVTFPRTRVPATGFLAAIRAAERQLGIAAR